MRLIDDGNFKAGQRACQRPWLTGGAGARITRVAPLASLPCRRASTVDERNGRARSLSSRSCAFPRRERLWAPVRGLLGCSAASLLHPCPPATLLPRAKTKPKPQSRPLTKPNLPLSRRTCSCPQLLQKLPLASFVSLPPHCRSSSTCTASSSTARRARPQRGTPDEHRKPPISVPQPGVAAIHFFGHAFARQHTTTAYPATTPPTATSSICRTAIALIAA